MYITSIYLINVWNVCVIFEYFEYPNVSSSTNSPNHNHCQLIYFVWTVFILNSWRECSRTFMLSPGQITDQNIFRSSILVPVLFIFSLDFLRYIQYTFNTFLHTYIGKIKFYIILTVFLILPCSFMSCSQHHMWYKETSGVNVIAGKGTTY